jgi:hypothetical protein
MIMKNDGMPDWDAAIEEHQSGKHISDDDIRELCK